MKWKETFWQGTLDLLVLFFSQVIYPQFMTISNISGNTRFGQIWSNLIKIVVLIKFDQIQYFLFLVNQSTKKKQNHTIQKHFKWLYLQDFAAQITLEAVYHKCNSWQKGYSLDKREPCSGPCLPRWWKPWSPRLLQWRVWKLTLAKRVQKYDKKGDEKQVETQKFGKVG